VSSPARVISAERLVSVAVPVPRLGLLTYHAPPGPALAPGMRVRVPLGSRALIGFIARVDVSDAASANADAGARPPAGARTAVDPANPGNFDDFGHPNAKKPAIKDILEVLDQEPFFPEDVLRIALWTAEYYLCGPGETLAAASPPFARGRRFAFKQQRIARLTRPVTAEETMTLKLTPKQADAIARLAEAPDGILVAALQKRDISPAVLAGLAKRGLIVIEDEVIERDPFVDDEMARAGGESPFAITPTDDQQRVLTELQHLAARNTFDVALLHGVTGSGKTQVYLRLADAVRKAGRRVLMLVPEISLTPAMAAVFRRAFGDRVAIQHSGLSDGERHDQWHRIRRGDVDIVVGTRSAVFAPVPSLGLIVVDEEHDTSYKQEESPRYHGRDVAIMRAKQANALVLLGSATPSLETYQHAQAGRYRHLALDRRVLDRPLAAVRSVDMREVYAEEGPDIILSAPLRDALQQRLAANEQSLILLNRRGYAAAIFCRQCAATLECPNCSVTLTIHRTSSRARCHYCDHEARVPEKCVKCGGEFLEYRGFGTERIEAEVKAAWPEARVARVDRDTVRRRGAIARLLHRFAQRELDILIGTQMIAKGHDFPEVTLVGVISADIGLGVADFRAAERTFQLLTQVVGRAGRGVRQGEAIIQTLYPHHYSVDHASRQDYRAFFEDESRYRKAMHYPPVLSLINVIVRGPSLEAATRDARVLVRALGGQRSHAVAEAARDAFYVLGPARAPLAKLRGEHRAQFFLKGTQRNAMRQAIAQALARHPEIARRTSVDVDPLSML
jgi:primosomal protein N' (replication factor Y) (superfamily II helicase)